jgi:hypothetical protein
VAGANAFIESIDVMAADTARIGMQRHKKDSA